MIEFVKFESSQTSKLGDLVDVVTRIGTLGEAKVLEMVSAGKFFDLFPFKPTAAEMPPDMVEENELTEASAMPPNRERRAALIQSSMPARSARLLKRKQSYPGG